ncbi:MAG: hypothetical protein JWO48_1601 [Bryobacterales bacterium]|nr:hypothetical protein [Bryobacterales bacterium]
MRCVPEIECAPLDAKGLPVAVELLSQAGISVAGVQSASLCRALCEDAVSNRGVTVVIAGSDHDPAGFVVAIIHPSAYWRSFVLRRPVLGFKMVWRRLFGGREGELFAAQLPDDAAGLLEAEATTHSWAQSDPTIARILFIGVQPKFRRHGIGEALYRRLFEVLPAAGVRFVHARAGCDNLPSLRLHHRTGWKLYRDRECVFALYQLDPINGSTRSAT